MNNDASAGIYWSLVAVVTGLFSITVALSRIATAIEACKP